LRAPWGKKLVSRHSVSDWSELFVFELPKQDLPGERCEYAN
jgi:hypothetical protein